MCFECLFLDGGAVWECVRPLGGGSNCRKQCTKRGGGGFGTLPGPQFCLCSLLHGPLRNEQLSYVVQFHCQDVLFKCVRQNTYWLDPAKTVSLNEPFLSEVVSAGYFGHSE